MGIEARTGFGNSAATKVNGYLKTKKGRYIYNWAMV